MTETQVLFYEVCLVVTILVCFFVYYISNNDDEGTPQ